MTTTQHPRYLDARLISLQVLRAIAALMVAVGHLYPIDQRFFGGPSLPAAAQFGFMGVDLFFVLSGFVMIYLTHTSEGNPALVPAFLFARVARIYPMWWLALGAIVLVWAVRPDWVFASISGAPNLLADFSLWPSTRLPLLAVGWTLIHEMYFYLVFALLLLLPRRHLYRGVVVWMLLVIVGNFLLGSQVVTSSPLLRLVTHPLTLNFSLGIAVGALVTQRVRPNPIALIIVGAIWALTAALLKLDDPLSVFDAHWTRMLSFGPAWALVTWGMVGMEADKGNIPLRILAGVGDASYSLYLIHVPIFAACARVAALLCGPAAWDNMLAWLLLLAVSTGSALLLHHLVEKPFLKQLTRIRFRLMPKGSALLASQPSSLGLKT